MKNNSLYKEVKKIFAEALEIIKKKNAHYATKKKPYRSLEFSKELNIVPWKGAMLRLTDKLCILYAFLKNNLEYEHDETFRETLIDIINYSATVIVLLEKENPNPDTVQQLLQEMQFQIKK